MRVFITGGAGFIGTFLSRSLMEAGNKVTAYDNLSNSAGDVPDGVRLVTGDILDAGPLQEAMAGHDVVVHLAAQIYVQRSVEDPGDTMRTNVEGSRNVAEACEETGVEGMVAVSSAAVYGDACGEGEVLDEGSRCSPLSPYAQSKLEMEGILKMCGTDSIILRLFNVYGPGLTSEYAGVITKFAGAIRDGGKVRINGDGNQTRDFVAIDDVAGAIWLAIRNVRGKRGDIYNIGTGAAVSINDLAGTMIGASGRDATIVHAEARPGDIRFSRTGIQKARDGLGFEPRMRLEDGIKKYWDSF